MMNNYAIENSVMGFEKNETKNGLNKKRHISKLQSATYIVGTFKNGVIDYVIKEYHKAGKIFYGDILAKENFVKEEDIIHDNVLPKEYSTLLEVTFLGCKGIGRCYEHMPLAYLFSKKTKSEDFIAYDVVEDDANLHDEKKFVIMIKKDQTKSENGYLVNWNKTKYQESKVIEIVKDIEDFNKEYNS